MNEVLLTIILVLIVALGPVLGSFFTAQVVRGINGKRKYANRSICDSCGHLLFWFDLIPIFSFLSLRGRCRYCGKNIEVKTWLTEVMGLIFFSLLSLGIGSMYATGASVPTLLCVLVSYFLLLCCLYYLSVVDLFTFGVPAKFTYMTTLVAVGINAIVLVWRLANPSAAPTVTLGGLGNLSMGIVAAGVVYLLMRFTKQKGIGSGDLLIALTLGLMLGWPAVIGAFYVIVIVGSLAGIAYALTKKKFKGVQIPLVPFMTLGFVIAAFWGSDIFHFLFLWP